MAKSKITDINEANAKIDQMIAEKEAQLLAESKEEQQLELKKRRLEIEIATNKSLGERFKAQQGEIELLEVLKDLMGDAYKSAEQINDLEQQIAEERDNSKRKELEGRLENLKLLAEENKELPGDNFRISFFVAFLGCIPKSEYPLCAKFKFNCMPGDISGGQFA